MKLTGDAFENGATIPTRFTCEGEDLSPPLTWSGVPQAAETLVLICDDPDAPNGVWSHWVVYNLPPVPEKLEEGVSLDERLSEGLREGQNDFGRQGYGGPCPPQGDSAHRYYFRLFALDHALDFKGRVTREQILDAIEGQTLDQAVLMGRFQRS
jgi:Raf kinase inhibitor-like YbhB/YbcL family protein